MRALISERPAASIQEIFLLSLHYYFFPKKRKKDVLTMPFTIRDIPNVCVSREKLSGH